MRILSKQTVAAAACAIFAACNGGAALEPRPPAAPETVRQASSGCRGWRVVKSANESTLNNELYAVSPSTSNTLWAVGSYEKQLYGAFSTLIEKWNGKSWRVENSPNAGSGDNELYGVAAASASDVWAVGEQNANSTSRPTPLVEHWDGSTWRIIDSPSDGQLSVLGGVATVSSGDVWAVGAFFNASGNQQTLVEHWNGSKWSVVTSPSPGASYNSLGHLAVVSANDIWATGSWSTGYTSQTLVERWNGKKWSVVSSPNVPGALYNDLGGIAAVNASDLWTVGSSESYGTYVTRTLIERWNGKEWKIVSSPNIGSGENALAGIAKGSASNLWAVGLYFPTPSGLSRSLIERWNGKAWQIVKSPNPGTTYDQLRGITSDSAGFWAVGAQASGQGGESLVEFHC